MYFLPWIPLGSSNRISRKFSEINRCYSRRRRREKERKWMNPRGLFAAASTPLTYGNLAGAKTERWELRNGIHNFEFVTHKNMSILFSWVGTLGCIHVHVTTWAQAWSIQGIWQVSYWPLKEKKEEGEFIFTMGNFWLLSCCHMGEGKKGLRKWPSSALNLGLLLLKSQVGKNVKCWGAIFVRNT